MLGKTGATIYVVKGEDVLVFDVRDEALAEGRHDVLAQKVVCARGGVWVDMGPHLNTLRTGAEPDTPPVGLILRVPYMRDKCR